MIDPRDENIRMMEKTFPVGLRVYECDGTVPWLCWGVVDVNKRPAVVMVRVHDGQLRAVWCDRLIKKINNPENHWVLEPKNMTAYLDELEKSKEKTA